MITYDLRGHGDSDKPVGDDHYLDGSLWADDLKAVMDGAGLRRPVLVGWSLGGLPMGNYLQKYGDTGLAGLNFVDAMTKRSRDFAGLPENRTLLPNPASPDLGTLVTHGAEDGQISVKITEWDKSVMPHATVSIYDGCGHSPFYEMAPRFNEELAGFVRSANA